MSAPPWRLQLRSGAKTPHDLTMQSSDSTLTAPPPPVNLSEKDIARFWSKVNKDGPTMPHMESPCWVWKAYKNKAGYGQIKKGRINYQSHRIVWIITNGPIPHDSSYHGVCVCHRCDNPSCVNPDHLFLGGHKENMLDREEKGRNNTSSALMALKLQPECLARGEAHGRAKITAVKVLAMRACYASGGITQRQLVVQFGVCLASVNKIILRKTWKHLL